MYVRRHLKVDLEKEPKFTLFTCGWTKIFQYLLVKHVMLK